ncbi:MAG: hypothetical protein JWN40_4488 [Phycisphaerales bacterium]|nr:hypothetical protein [Phycisphaerales bacterium]
MVRLSIKRSAVVVGVLGLAVVAGCESSGLSPRETHGGDYSTYLYSLYDDGGATAQPGRPGADVLLRAPLRVGVAQVGEVGPAEGVLARLRAEPTLFASVQAVPAVFERMGQQTVDAAEARRRVSMMRQHARDLGMDYLLMYGGTMDFGSEQTSSGLLDLTIVGAYVMPSKDVKAVGRSAAAMVDVRTGRVVLSASSEGERKKWVPTMAQGGAQVEVLKGLRDEMVGRLADAVVTRVRERAGG